MSCIADCAVVVRCGRHGVSELQVVFVNALDETVFSELPEIALVSRRKACGDVGSGARCLSFLLIGIMMAVIGPASHAGL